MRGTIQAAFFVWSVFSVLTPAVIADPPVSGLDSGPRTGAWSIGPDLAAPPVFQATHPSADRGIYAVTDPIAPASYANNNSYADEKDDTTYFTIEELRKEMEKIAWKKGDFHIIPYGVFWGDAIYATSRTYPGAYTLWVPSEDAEGEDSFVIDARRTRVGLNVTGPEVPFFNCAKSGGQLEFDFFGAFETENKPGVLLRHAYAEIKNDSFRLLGGQTWDVISPLYPGTLMYSIMWAQGNIGYRRAQIRLERYHTMPAGRKLTLQLSLNEDIVSDFVGVQNVEREPSDWPVIEGRLAITDEEPYLFHGPVTLGVSGHIGEQGFDFTANSPVLDLPPVDDARVKTWSINADLRIPVTDRFGVQGEFFAGQNLGTFLGGIAQGVCPCSRRGIRARGGWVDFWYDWSPSLHSHVGYAVDDPIDRDLMY
ncbi:MAG: hypothetical protein JW829_07500, partial [Pirellulales bacterium]|nr:hypothetical protein [Pirellulales bacterium]